MNFNNRKIFSTILSLLIVLTMVFSTFTMDIVHGVEEDNAKALLRQTLEDAREEQGVELERNIPDEDEIVTFIVEVEEYSVKDLSRGLALDIAIKDKYIVENVLDSQESYMKEIKKINKDAEFNNQYTLAFNGFSVRTKYGDKKKIESISGVKKVSLAKTYYKDIKNAVEASDIPYVLEEYGYNGEGKVVAVLDSGIDHTHKDMVISPRVDVKLNETKINEIKNKQAEKRGKYFTSKIPFGYNYADKNDDILDRVVQNIDHGHGMHVAGIIGANCQSEHEISLNKGIRGIAPESQILAMKIFSNDVWAQGASEADIISAIEDSIAYGADVINMSFCSTAGFQNPEDGQQKAIQAAIDEGIIVVAAAGNGAYSTYPYIFNNLLDIGTVGAPGVAQNSIQVASFENIKRVAYGLNAIINGETEIVPYVLSDFDPVILKDEYEVVDCGFGQVGDLKDLDLTNKIALIKRGIIEFQDKKLNAQNKGAVGVIIYNSDGEEEYLDYISTDEKVSIPTIFIKNSDGVKLSEMISQGLRVSFSGKEVEIENPSIGQMSYFSGWGPTPNLDLKPDITAVGGNVWSTVNNNEYRNMSGTSMATPYTAGIMVLILQHLDEINMEFNTPVEKAKYAKTMIMNTAEVKVDKKTGKPYSPRIQGSGLINVKRALENKTVLTYNGSPSAALGEIGKNTDLTFTLYNGSGNNITYSIETMIGQDAEIVFDANEIIVEAGQTLEVNGKLVLGNIEEDNFVEGFIRFVSVSDHVSVGMPFLGFYGDWANLKIVDEPVYNEGSIFEETSLYTTKPGDFGMRVYKLGGNDINPDYFAINPEDKSSNYNVLPQFSLLRNAKELIIDITDENGIVRKVLEDKEDLRKEIVVEQDIFAKVNFNWLWHGDAYDKELGYNKFIDEGQYYINIRAKADFEGAEEQVTTFPLKIDKTPPEIKVKYLLTEDNEFILEMEAEDKGIVDSGIDSFLFLVDERGYKDENGNSIFNLTKDEDGKYRMNMRFPEGEKKPFYVVDIGVTDHADNMEVERIIVSSSQADNKLIIQHLESITSFTNGEEVLTKINVINNYEVAKDLTLMLSLYDEDNKLVNFAGVEKNIKPGKDATLTSSIAIPDYGKYTLKVLIWDNFNDLEPLDEVIEIKNY